MGVKEAIEDKIKSKKVMVIAKSTCGYSIMAKNVFADYIKSGNLDKKDYGFWDIDGEKNCQAIQDELENMTGARSVPRVFINGKFFGGGDDVKAAASKGKLKEYL
uniref:Glutaredoxin A n=1 Tax=Ruditapes philippinarum TaxID=129788 RepID=C8CBL7_RUDPH|nr:glutaredoxin A [Ruditapes philippinarum]